MRSKLSQSWKGLAIGGAVAVMTASSAYAATQGAPGATSQGDLDIEISVNDVVQISNLADVTFPTFTTGDQIDTQGVCVYRNGVIDQDYTITASGDGGGSAFTLSGLATPANTVPYSVDWDDGDGFVNLLTTGTVTMNHSDNGNDDCTVNGDNVDLRITILAADLAAMPADTYDGTLTLLVAPI